ncbi:MAG: hypothetical protein JRJ15_06455 [Deltaproteobacteria bacterium]|nr:hypothetical protein [Deltaproteobacteria bacterium]
MRLLNESLYGWGVCDIPTPRAALDIFTDRRKRSAQISFADRRKPALEHGILSIASGLLTQDVPWTQTLVLGFVSLFSFASIYLASNTIPQHPEKQLSRTVDIIINVIEDTINAKPLLVDQTVPPVQETDMLKENVFHEETAQKPQQQALAETKPIEEQEPVPMQELKTTPEETFSQITLALRIKKRPLRASQTDAPKNESFENTAQPQEIRISGPVALKSNYSISYARQGFRSEQPDFISDSFSTQPRPAAITISQPNPFRRRYATGASGPIMAATSDEMPRSNILDLTYPAESDDAALPKTHQTDERYPLEDQGVLHGRLASPKTANESLSFGPRNIEESLMPQTQPRSLPGEPRPILSSPIDGRQAPDFSGAVSTDEIDPSHLISLNEFDVCTDPEEEFRLKTKLVSLLEGPSSFRTRNVIFFFKYTELPYTINVDIYNHEGEPFQDRCSVLNLAIESIRNT